MTVVENSLTSSGGCSHWERGPGEYRFEPELLKILKQSVGPLVRTCRSLECS